MGKPPRPGPGERLGALLRRLGESAEQHDAARARLVDGLDRLLSAAPGDAAASLDALVAASPSLDAGCLILREEGRWRRVAEVGEAGGPEVVADPGSIERLAVALRDAGPLVSSGSAVGASLLPDGTLAACAVPLLGRSRDVAGVLLAGSRARRRLDAEDLLLARVAADRLAAALEAARLAGALARGDEATRQTGRFRDQVLAIVGHDLRNPLGAIVMSAALLRSRGGLEGWQAKTVDRIRSSAARMGRIIDDLLSYTRTRLGSGIPVEPAETDLAELARRMVDELAAAHAGVRVELRADGDLRGEWDGARLEQVISNVVSNAIDHGEDGEPVRVSVCAAGEAVELVVENRGEMPREVLDHAFEAFQRGPEPAGRKASGLGLGLYIAREIVQRHSGSIAARSRDGCTRVVVRLPRRPGAAAAAGAP